MALRKINATMRSELFQQIAMKLVRADLEQYNADVKDFGYKLYREKYQKYIDKMAALPKGFFETTSHVLSPEPLYIFTVSVIADCWMPVGKAQKYREWFDINSNIKGVSAMEVKVSDRFRVNIPKSDLKKKTFKELIALRDRGKSLAEEKKKILAELKSALNSCKTVKQLLELLPEFAEMYPSVNDDNFPVPVTSVANLRNAAKAVMKVKKQEAVT